MPSTRKWAWKVLKTACVSGPPSTASKTYAAMMKIASEPTEEDFQRVGFSLRRELMVCYCYRVVAPICLLCPRSAPHHSRIQKCSSSSCVCSTPNKKYFARKSFPCLYVLLLGRSSRYIFMQECGSVQHRGSREERVPFLISLFSTYSQTLMCDLLE